MYIYIVIAYMGTLTEECINGGRGEERVTLHSHCRNSRISCVLLCI